MAKLRSVFEFLDYKEFLREFIASRPNKGHGELRRMSQALRVHSTLMSQITRGNRELTLEQGAELAAYMQLNEREQRYFLILIQFMRAGSVRLREIFLSELNQLRKQEEDISSKFPQTHEFDERAKAEFYSSWTYSAVRLATDLLRVRTAKDISHFLDLPETLVEKHLIFLVKHGFCISHEGSYALGNQVTHIPRTSPYIVNHHRNWRLKTLENLHKRHEDDFVFTAPVSISKKNAKEVSHLLLTLVEQLRELAVNSKGEELRVMNLDWVQLGGRRTEP